MARKVFLSFLGTNNYIECNYCYGEECVEKVRFVQEAMVKLFCKDFSEEDQIYIFVTGQAEEKNWNDTTKDGIKVEGLDTRLKKLSFKGQISHRMIPAGHSESEIWKIFKTVFENLQEDDEVIFDITHGFRSLPMLGLVLLNYARFIKKITIRKVYYGAFEVLGAGFEIRRKPMEERNAPIFDFTGFVRLQDWTVAVGDFLKNGQTAHLKELVKIDVNPILEKSKLKNEEAKSEGKNEEARNIRKLFNLLDEFAENIFLNRGPQIGEAKGKEINDLLSKIEDNFIQPLKPIVKKIKEKVEGLQNDDLINGMVAVRWSIEHNLVPQAYTLLFENIITIVLEEYNKKFGESLKKTDKDLRNAISSAFKIKYDNISESDWKGNKKLIKEILSMEILGHEQLVENFEILRNMRNDIDHAGWSENAIKSGKLKEKIQSIYSNIMSILYPYNKKFC